MLKFDFGYCIVFFVDGTFCVRLFKDAEDVNFYCRITPRLEFVKGIIVQTNLATENYHKITIREYSYSIKRQRIITKTIFSKKNRLKNLSLSPPYM